jgi:hypothetical protein
VEADTSFSARQKRECSLQRLKDNCGRLVQAHNALGVFRKDDEIPAKGQHGQAAFNVVLGGITAFALQAIAAMASDRRERFGMQSSNVYRAS